MSDNHFQLPTSELDPIFQFAKRLLYNPAQDGIYISVENGHNK